MEGEMLNNITHLISRWRCDLKERGEIENESSGAGERGIPLVGFLQA